MHKNLIFIERLEVGSSPLDPNHTISSALVETNETHYMSINIGLC